MAATHVSGMGPPCGCKAAMAVLQPTHFPPQPISWLRWRRQPGSMWRRHACAVRRRRCSVAAAEMGVEWGPVVEQMVLCSSVALAFVAGMAAPARMTSLPFQQKQVQFPQAEAAALDESGQHSDVHTSCIWDETWKKFDLKLAQVIARLEGAELHVDGPLHTPVLSLQAIAKGPRFRLLRAASEHLCSEVRGISDVSQSMEAGRWCDYSLDMLSSMVVPACQTWLSQELPFGIQEPESQFTQLLVEDAAVASFAADYLRRRGKVELYADFLFFLRFRAVRSGSLCSYKVFSRYAEYIFEDLVISVADATAEIYLNGSSSDIMGFDSGDWPTLLRPSLSSTRTLERFRNEVALREWLQRNFASVEAMYEDRFELWTLQKSSRKTSNQASKAKKITAGSSTDDSAKDLIFIRSKLPARRSRELKALSGWRYNFTLYLEFSDVVGPLLRALLSKLGDVISFLLVRLIGRSLGLIYRGVRQSLNWSPS